MGELLYDMPSAIFRVFFIRVGEICSRPMKFLVVMPGIQKEGTTGSS
jgi:hypothetical protein